MFEAMIFLCFRNEFAIRCQKTMIPYFHQMSLIWKTDNIYHNFLKQNICPNLLVLCMGNYTISLF
jgi:hypothetical protein